MWELSHAPYRLQVMGLRQTVVVLVLVFASCSSDGAVSTTVTSEESADMSPTTTRLPLPSTTTITQPKTTVTETPTLSDSGQSGFDDFLGISERAC